ncbi:MAG TPA: TonB-dependent receptor, partial [Bryobacteraceae bacterium]|nr:TonB-dependent receptor [Bryobacteraceae bacterium]
GADGSFQITNIPLQTYTAQVTKDGFQTWRQSLSLRSNVPQALEAQLVLAAQTTSVQVSASDTLQIVDTEATGTRTEINASTIARMPIAPSNRGLEAMLVSSPGFAANANGAIHPRGAHNQMTYVVDGMPIADQLTGAFANAVDPSLVQTVELFTGNVPAEFGSKVSGVAVITTRSGMGSARAFSGSTQATAGEFDTFGSLTQVSGGSDKWGYFGSVNILKSNRYLDQVSIDNLHNGGNSQRGFGRIDYMATSRDTLRFSVMSGRSGFQLANLRSQHAAGQDQRQELEDVSISGGWLRTLNSSTTVDTTVSWRTAWAKLLPSPADIPVTAAQDRRMSTFTAASRWNHIRGRHTLRVGADAQRYPVRESFTLGITSAEFNRPESEEFIPTLLPHDLTRGGSPFRFSAAETGGMYSAFAQDTVRLGRLTLNLGARYDAYRFLVNGNQFQPRIGLAFNISETKTVLRASYNRTYQTPPNENLLLSSSTAAAVLVPAIIRESFGRAITPIVPERQNVFEVGLQQGVGRHLSLSAAYYHKDSRDLQDNDNFLNTGIIFPITLARSRTNGAEGRLTLVPWRGLSGSLSLTHIRTIVTPPFTGGLFLGSAAVESLSAGPFIIDHDQTLGAHGLVSYNLRRNLWVSTSVRYDSGLVANPSDPAEVAADPDYADLLPYVNLLSDPARVRPRTIVDIAVGYDHIRNDRRTWDAGFQISNIGNVTALYNFQSIFVGTRLVQPRTASVKLRFWF